MFHAQQGAEKSLKGFLTWHQVPFRKTHDLRELFAACKNIDASLHELGEKAEELTPFAWVFRYPGETESPSLEEARAAEALGQEVYEAIIKRLTPEVTG
jgi:HEPN domain-containing protein